MRWLTREWQSGALPEGERTSRWQTYLEHRDVTAIHLPPALHRLAAVNVEGALTLHRAVPEWWALEPGKALTLSLISGDDGHLPDAGPQRIVLQYLGNLEVVGATPDAIDAWLAHPDGCLLYDEIDVLPGRRFEQRFLLAPDGELTLRFDSVVLLSAPTTIEARDELQARRADAGEPPSAPVATTANDAAPAAPSPVDSPERHSAPDVVVADPPEGSPAPVPVPTTEAGSLAPAADGKRSLRDTLLSWLPGVRGSRS